MAKMKVHEYAKQIGKPAKEIVSLLNDNGITVKSHLSNVEDDGINFLNKHFKANITGADDAKVAAPKKEAIKEEAAKEEKVAARPASRASSSGSTKNTKII